MPLIHGLSQTHGYKVWQMMLLRCYNDSRKDYPSYGGRGITVCDRWRESIHNFLADMGQPPPGTQLDRIDNDGPYQLYWKGKLQCRWATPKQNRRNSRDNHHLTFRGRKLCVAAWGERTGISEYTIHKRLARGWSIKRALTTVPLPTRNKRATHPVLKRIGHE